MKSAVAVALIVCGTLLVVAPAIHEYMLAREAFSVLRARTDLTHIDSAPAMSVVHQYICWALGVGMIALAVVQSVRRPMTHRALGQPAAA